MNAYNERRSDPENFGEGITTFGGVGLKRYGIFKFLGYFCGFF
jgi:hypothetical protein